MTTSAWDTRSIPACAGEPGRPTPDRPPTAVYPRVCGGTAALSAYCRPLSGLSPRVRGNQIPGYVLWTLTRSIPACAGEPGRRPEWRGGTKVYPRVCGGTAPAARRLPVAQGLSPRVRGNPSEVLIVKDTDRSIPACAGEPAPSSSSSQYVKVYPRVCGGTRAANSRPTSDHGLSPRVRGNRSTFSVLLPTVGSIPACAGEPCEYVSGHGA